VVAVVQAKVQPLVLEGLEHHVAARQQIALLGEGEGLVGMHRAQKRRARTCTRRNRCPSPMRADLQRGGGDTWPPAFSNGRRENI